MKYWRHPTWRACTVEERFSCQYFEEGRIVYICPVCGAELTATNDIRWYNEEKASCTYVCSLCKIAFEGLPYAGEKEKPMPVVETPDFRRKDETAKEVNIDKSQAVVYHDEPLSVPSKFKYLLG